jgi:type I restriction enzyme S subunit
LTVNLGEPTLRNITPKEQEGRIVQKNNLLLEKSGGGELQPVGCVVLYEHDCVAVCSNFVAKVELAQGMNPSYWRYVHASTYSVRLNTRSIKQTSGIQNLDHQQYFDEMAPFPPLQEQEEIAAFLDQETSKIDALITEQQRLIELLKEKRQAVISHAVTKGLNPDVRMKPSGVEWLGEVPEHWEVTRLKFLSDIQTGGRDTENAVDNGAYPFFVRSQIVERIDSMSFDCEAVLTAGDGAGVGKVFHYHDGPFDFHQRVYMMNNFRGITGKFLFHYFRENFYKVALEGGAKSTVDSLRRPMLADFWVCVPPKEEQSAIVDEVERQVGQFDSLITEAEQGVRLLSERRTALISAAVTGKIDVRNYASTQKDAA